MDGGATTKSIIVAGAGPAGLFTAWNLARRGRSVIVLEREERVGGLAAALPVGQNFYGYGTHHLHNPDPEKLRPFKELMGPDLVELDRKILIKFRGRLHPYPLTGRHLVSSLPLPLLAACGVDLLRAMVVNRRKRGGSRNAEEAIIALYGKRLYEIMFREYTTRFWGIPPSRISPLFVEKRMPGINAVESLKRAMRRIGLAGKESLGRTTVIGSPKMYTTSRGVGAVFERMAEAVAAGGGRVLTSAELLTVHRSEGRIRSVTFRHGGEQHTLPCDLLISTIPVNRLAARLDPTPPPSVRTAAERLGFRALLVTGILARPRRRLGALFTYFPGRTFHRVAEVAPPAAKVAPPGCVLFLAETTCEKGDEVWNDPAPVMKRVVEELVEEGLVEREGILETHPFRTAEAYPKYFIGFESDLHIIHEHLAGLDNLVTAGRQGSFRFARMIPAMEEAWRKTRDRLEQADRTAAAAKE